ncbi:hypothetical protein [uncultured Alistipes sp.]|jgi:hypothetical protein|uniref:hypothetical protein n=1 Tax=uncultured Alistipes sp. TaxID=538949 RepID=UPI0025D05058|nr:hypothetical protein [uncultured Alistipes sp.]
MKINITQRGPFEVMTAPEGYYITQVAEDAENRIYVRERMVLSGESAGDWRVADKKEKGTFEKQQNEEI